MQTSSTEFADLTPKQIKCLPLIAIGYTAKDVSKKLKVSEVQLSEWRRDPNFMTALDFVRREALRDAEMALSGLAMDAVQVLKESLNSASGEQTRLRAAMYIIDRLGFSPNLDSMGLASSGIVNMNLLLTALGTKSGSA
jgi:hypothetical protein